MENIDLKIYCAVAIMLTFYSCDKVLAKKLAGTYRGAYSYETIEVYSSSVDTVYTTNFIVTENEHEILFTKGTLNPDEGPFNDTWSIPVDGVRHEKRYEERHEEEYGDGGVFYKSILFEGDSVYYYAHIINDGNAGSFIFSGVRIK